MVIENPDGAGAFVIVCDHASRQVPAEYGSLGVAPEILETHIAWDPGALAVARQMSDNLDAPLLWPDTSRLIIDCNRDPSAHDLIVAEGEGQPIPGNRGIGTAERTRRLETIHAPYHAAIDACVVARSSAGLPTSLIAIHSFTPVLHGRSRPWQIGIVFDSDQRLAAPVIRQLTNDPALTVGINEPYAPSDRVYYTLARHGSSRDLPAVMIEIRNDEIADTAGQHAWANRLAGIFRTIEPAIRGAGHAAA